MNCKMFLVFKIVLIVAGVISLAWFLAPIFVWAIFNIGNFVGIVYSSLLILSGIYLDKIVDLIGNFWHMKVGKVVLSVVLVFCVSLLSFILYSTGAMIHSVVKEPQKNSTLVVLGCKVYGTKPSLLLRYRLDSALEYLNENPQSKAVLSGGQGADEDISEAQCMYEYLVENGVDKSRLFLEDKSTNTFENIKFSKAVMDGNGIDSEKVVVVTNSFHLYRGELFAKKCNINADGLGAKSNIITLPTFYVRELLGILRLQLLGY